MPETYSIDGIAYSEEELVAILRGQIPRRDLNHID